MGDFDNYKNRKANKKEKMKESLKNNREYKREVDTRFWQPTKEKDGTTSAIIRLVGLKDNNDANFITLYNYIFKNKHTNKWYWENSLRTVGQDDPVAKYNAARWIQGYEEEVRARKLTTTNITNVYVVKDSANPENEGKVFLYRFGGQIKKLIAKTLEDLKEGDEIIKEGFDPFDYWEGANLLVKGEYRDSIHGKGKIYTYENSTFLKPTSFLGGDDKKLETDVYNKMFNTFEFIDPTTFKSFDELADKLALVEGISRSDIDEAIGTLETHSNKESKKETKKSVEVPSKKGKKKSEETEPVDEESENIEDMFPDEELETLMNE